MTSIQAMKIFCKDFCEISKTNFKVRHTTSPNWQSGASTEHRNTQRVIRTSGGFPIEERFAAGEIRIPLSDVLVGMKRQRLIYPKILSELWAWIMYIKRAPSRDLISFFSPDKERERSDLHGSFIIDVGKLQISQRFPLQMKPLNCIYITFGFFWLRHVRVIP